MANLMGKLLAADRLKPSSEAWPPEVASCADISSDIALAPIRYIASSIAGAEWRLAGGMGAE
jgi:hypothetical protein